MSSLKESLGQINNLPLSERVLSAIRNAILRGELAPGQVLVETELASQLSVSRAPIREALHILDSEGLVEIIPYHKTIVRKVTQADVEQLYDLRSLLETFAVRRIIVHGIEEDIIELRQLYAAMMQAAEDHDLSQVSEIDRTFHDTLINLSRHNVLLHTWKAISYRVRQVMALRGLHRKIANREIKGIAESHFPIIEAIAAGNEREAVNLIQQHIATSGDLIAADWENSEAFK